jgi:pSer/pThr/pTyr-binding forkhead associated (FHA) protein
MSEVQDRRALRAAEEAGFPFLWWRDGDGVQQIIVLEPDRWRVTVGRNPACDISLTFDPEVSRGHAVLERVGDQWTIDDGPSMNGTYMDGTKVVTRQPLHDGVRLCFGVTFVTYQEPEGADPAPSTQPADPEPAIPLTPTQRAILIALCRPMVESRFASPATNRQIADETHHGVDSVKAHLRVLFDRFGIRELAQNEKRTRLAGRVLADGILKPHDF